MRYFLIGLFFLEIATAGYSQQCSTGNCPPVVSFRKKKAMVAAPPPQAQQPAATANATVNIAAAPPPAYGPNWKSDVIDWLKTREDQVAYIKTLSMAGVNGAEFSLRALGLPGGFVQMANGGWAYRTTMETNTYNSFGALGNSVTGYSSVNGLVNPFTPIDLNAPLQQAGLNIKSAQDYTAGAMRDLTGVVGDLGSYVGRIGEINAKVDGLMKLADKLQASPSTSGVTTKTTLEPVTPPQMPLASDTPKTVAPGPVDFVAKVLLPACGACHNANAERSFNIQKWTTMTPDDKDDAISRVFSKDPKVGMPRDKATGKFTPLNATVKRLFAQY